MLDSSLLSAEIFITELSAFIPNNALHNQPLNPRGCEFQAEAQHYTSGDIGLIVDMASYGGKLLSLGRSGRIVKLASSFQVNRSTSYKCTTMCIRLCTSVVFL